MLMVNGMPRTSGLGNFYFSPVRLRPVFEPAYYEKPRPKRMDSQLDLSLDLTPKLRHKGGNSKVHSTNRENDEEETADEEDVAPKRKQKKKNNHGENETGKKKNDATKKKEIKKSHRDEYESGEESEAPKEKEKKKNKRKDKKHKNKKHEDSKSDEMFQNLCSKLGVSYVLGTFGIIILFACCCALYLRSRIVACCRRCWPFGKRKKKTPSKTNLFDVEGGEYPYQSSLKSPFKKSKKNKNPPRLIDTGIQDSRTTMAMAQDEPPTPPVGCSSCIKKKKKKTSKQRRK